MSSKSNSTKHKDTEAEPLPAYDLHRSDDKNDIANENRLGSRNRGSEPAVPNQQNRYSYSASSDAASSEGYMDIHTASGGDSGTVGTAGYVWHNETNQVDPAEADATEAVAEMHLALLYLLSHPHELERAVAFSSNNNGNATTLQQWNAEYYYNDNDDQSLYTEAEPISSNASVSGATSTTAASAPPLPFAIFCDDAEVVLPQAHTASQLFGMETVTGMELEAAAGVPAVSRLFLRWLALMPGGDHLNLIDPPGLTVMKIAGGRYRVTAAHRVVWTWYNDLACVSDKNVCINALKSGDLVSLTIVDVFETENRGKLLSYCPTFDNRAVVKQDRAAHLLRKRRLQVQSALRTASHSALAVAVRRHASRWATQLYQAVEEAMQARSGDDEDHDHLPTDVTTIPASPPRNMSLWMNQQSSSNNNDSTTNNNNNVKKQTQPSIISSSAYQADDDMERHEV